MRVIPPGVTLLGGSSLGRSDPRQNDAEGQSNSLRARIEQSPDDVQLMGERLGQNEGSTDEAVLDQPRNKRKG